MLENLVETPYNIFKKKNRIYKCSITKRKKKRKKDVPIKLGNVVDKK